LYSFWGFPFPHGWANPYSFVQFWNLYELHALVCLRCEIALFVFLPKCRLHPGSRGLGSVRVCTRCGVPFANLTRKTPHFESPHSRAACKLSKTPTGRSTIIYKTIADFSRFGQALPAGFLILQPPGYTGRFTETV
jgi:hypothetical protein